MGSKRKHLRQAKAYISERRKAGHPEEEIRRSFEDAGWHPDIIEELFGKAREAEIKFVINFKRLFPKFKQRKRVKLSATDKHDVVLKANNISKSYQSRRVLSNLSFEIKKGDFIGVFGLSGCGKTTLLNMLVGFLEPDEGEIYYYLKGSEDFRELSRWGKTITNIFGFAPQTPSFYQELSVWDNLDYFGSLYGLSSKLRKKRILTLLEFFNLENASKLLGRDLSGGMGRRLGIACSMIHNPQILILDEPTSDLDPIMRKEVWSLMKKINDIGITVILTSHLLSEVEGLCNKLIILHNKRIVAEGSPETLYKKFPDENNVIILTKKQKYNKIISELQSVSYPISKHTQSDKCLIIQTSEPEKVVRFLLNIMKKVGDEIVNLELKRKSLKELFESYVTKME